MENVKARNALSVLIITAMVATMFALPALSDDSQAFAAAKSYKVKFNKNGGKFAKKQKKSKTVTKGKKYGALPKVTKTDYVFKGWYTKKVGGKKVTAKTKVKSKKKHTLYAQWTPEYDISKYTNVLGKGTSAIPVKVEPYTNFTGSGTFWSYRPYTRYTFSNYICIQVRGDVKTMISNFNATSMPVSTFFKKLGVTAPRVVQTVTDSSYPEDNNKLYEAKVGNAFVYMTVYDIDGKIFYDDTIDCRSVQRVITNPVVNY